ncbi:hypothetical protein ACS0TY_028072 [Phlomoides rotata]
MDENTQCDDTYISQVEDNHKPYVGKKFVTIESAFAFYNQYARESGFERDKKEKLIEQVKQISAQKIISIVQKYVSRVKKFVSLVNKFVSLVQRSSKGFFGIPNSKSVVYNSLHAPTCVHFVGNNHGDRLCCSDLERTHPTTQLNSAQLWNWSNAVATPSRSAVCVLVERLEQPTNPAELLHIASILGKYVEHYSISQEVTGVEGQKLNIVHFNAFRLFSVGNFINRKQPSLSFALIIDIVKLIESHITIRVVAIIAEGVPESDTKQLIAYAKTNNKVSNDPEIFLVVIGSATVGGIQDGAFKIGDTAGTIDNIIQCKLYRPGTIGFVSKSVRKSFQAISHI